MATLSVTLCAPKPGVSDADMEKKHAAWEKEFQAALQVYQKATKDAKPGDNEAHRKASEEYNKVYERRSEFMTEEMTGFVWLYLRK